MVGKKKTLPTLHFNLCITMKVKPGESNGGQEKDFAHPTF